MLVESDYDSWKIRIHRYIRGKPNGKLIWKSIQNGPTPHPMVTDPPPTNSTVMPAPRKKLDSEFNDEENKLEMADTQAEIILSQEHDHTQPRPYVRIYTHLKAYEGLMPNKYLDLETGAVYNYCYPWPMLLTPHLHLFFHHPHLPSPQLTCSESPNDALMATYSIANLLSRFQKQFRSQPTTSSGLPQTQGLMSTVHMVTLLLEPIQRKAPVMLVIQGLRRQEKALTYNKHVSRPPIMKDGHMTQTWMRGLNAAVAFMANWSFPKCNQHQVYEHEKDDEKPGHVRPANGFYEKLNALMFFPTNCRSETANWLPANERASQTSNPNSPVTPFVHKSRPPSQVLSSLRQVNAAFHQFEDIIKERTTKKPDYVSEWCFDYAKQFVEQQLIFDELERNTGSIVLTSDSVVPPRFELSCEDPVELASIGNTLQS
ncbi:hypothetical protein Tco_0661182 [Tanacetum coccineum]